MGLVYSPTFTIKINHSCRCTYQSHGSYGDGILRGLNFSQSYHQLGVFHGHCFQRIASHVALGKVVPHESFAKMRSWNL